MKEGAWCNKQVNKWSGYSLMSSAGEVMNTRSYGTLYVEQGKGVNLAIGDH